MCETAQYLRNNFDRNFVFFGDNAPYHKKGISELKGYLEANGDHEGRSYLNRQVKYTLTAYSMSNAIENGCFSPAKNRLYYSSIDPDDYRLS